MKPKILGLLDGALLAGPMAANAGYVAATWGGNSVHLLDDVTVRAVDYLGALLGLGLAGLSLSRRRRAN